MDDGHSDSLLARALEVAADLKARCDACGEFPKGIISFFKDVRALDERHKQQQAIKKKKEGGNRKGKPKQHQKQGDNNKSSSSSSALALTAANLRALKRQRTSIDQERASAATPLHPAPTPEVVILRLIELPKLLVVRIVHMLEFHELASLDTTCSKFHPFAPIGLTQLSAEMRAHWVLKPWQVKAKEVPRPVQAWSQWLAEEVVWRERVVRAGGDGRLACGGSADNQHTLVVSKKGVVMSCGYNVDDSDSHCCSLLGHGEGKMCQQHLTVIEALTGHRVVQVSAGSYHSLVLTDSGDVFSFGDGEDGKLGHGDRKHQYLPKLVEALKGKKVVQVCAGAEHSLVLTDSGDVFSFGWGFYGQLGHKENKHLPKLVEALKGKKVVQVSAGGAHSLALTDRGDVFSFGHGGGGELGHGDEEHQHLPKLVEALKGKKVVQVSAGDRFSLVLTRSGDVFSFGQGFGGRLGHGDKKDQHLPKLVEALKGKKVVQVSAGGAHSLVLTKSGKVFSFGYGEDGQLGHGDEKNQHLPKLVEALKGKTVIDVQAGANQSAVLTKKNGRILVSGLIYVSKKNPKAKDDSEDADALVWNAAERYLGLIREFVFGRQLIECDDRSFL